MACSCLHPTESPDPRKKPGYCNQCGRQIAMTDEVVREYFDALERTTAGRGFRQFRALAEHREKDGRKRFGQAFLGKENVAEGYEESVDLAIYPLLDSVKEWVHPSQDPDLDLVLTAAHHAFLAFEALRELAGKRRGTP